jgi:two-component system OmpR family response regulator
MAKILVIEDSVEIREMIILILNTYGHQVVSHSKRKDIESLIFNGNLDLALIDVWVGNTSGKNLCKQIKAADAELPIILMSDDPALLKDYESCLADDVIEKPFELKDFKNKINKALRKK